MGTVVQAGSVLLTLFAIALAYYFYRKAREFKALTLMTTQELSVRSVLNGFSRSARVSYEGNEALDLRRLELVLRNTGTLPILKGDVSKHIVISLGNGRFIEPCILDRRPSDLQMQAKVIGKKSTDLALEFGLMNPGDQVIIGVLCQTEGRALFEIHGHIAGVHEVDTIDMAIRHFSVLDRLAVLRKRIQQSGLVLWWGSVLILWAVLKLFLGQHYISFESGLSKTSWQELTASAVLLITGAVPVFYACHYLRRIKHGLGFFDVRQVAKLLLAPRTVFRAFLQFLRSETEP